MKRKTDKNQRRRPVQKRAIEKYTAIVDAAPRVLLEFGYHKATTENMALEAQVSIGSLYEYFGNKDDVFAAYINREMKNIMMAVSDQVTQNLHFGAEQMLQQLIHQGVDFVLQNQKIFSAVIREIPSLWEVEAIGKLEDKVVELAQLFSQAKKVQLSDQELQYFSLTLTNIVVGFYMRLAIMGAQKTPLDVLKKELLTVISGYIFERTGVSLFKGKTLSV